MFTPFKTILGTLALVAGSHAWLQLTPTFNDIWIPMSDGDSLQADVYLPGGASEHQVILIQTPYNKNNFSWSLPLGIGQNIDDSPFAFVIVDWRGFYGSANADLTGIDRGQDGYDICDWIVDQPWHMNHIGTWGPSALGGIQYQLIGKHHPAHTCAVPMVSTGQSTYEQFFYGGVLEKARLEQLDALGYGLSPIIMSNPYYNSTWQVAEYNSFYADDIIIPTLQIGGWYDHMVDEMMEFYEASRTLADASVQDEQWLLIGPWVHGGTGAAYVGSSIQGELLYPAAQYKSDSMAWDFFEYYLLDSTNNWQNTPLVTYFEMGGNDTWHTSNAASIEGASEQILYLNSLYRLTPEPGYGTSTFVVDPGDPSPTIGGATLHPDLDQGPYDQTYLDGRTDIYTFTSDTLLQELSVTGSIRLYLYVSADQPDCDIAIRLVDVYPDGTNMLITDGIRRMRFRNGYTLADEEFMVPGQVYAVEIELPFTNYTWLPDHQVKIYVGGNHSTRFDVNLQDGGPMYVSGTPNIANITIHHNDLYQSKMILPGDDTWLSVSEDPVLTFSVYPNPANDVLSIAGASAFDSYSVFDISGRMVDTGALTTNQIGIAGLETGIYVIRITNSDGGMSEQKFVKK